MGDARSEGEMCDVFAASATADGWVVYPETGGWDLVLVWPEHPEIDDDRARRQRWSRWLPDDRDPPPGTTIGIEAKRRPNLDVLAQAVDDVFRQMSRETPTGPDFRAVLVPKVPRPFAQVASHLGVFVYEMPDHRSEYLGRVHLPAKPYRWQPQKRLWLPPIVPSTTGGGRPSPRPLTPWRVGSLRLCALLRSRGYLTTADFREHGVSITTWRDRWIVRDGNVDGRRARYVAHPDPREPMPDSGFESERDRLAELDAAEAAAE